MQKSKKVRMPAGIRNKLMAAVAMLLVSSIMMVSSTYAWFTLSTAPEVTGITTSVGANGNLEMALLTSYTYVNPDSRITSNKNDSIAYTGDVTRSNITWGNLVDLSDVTYGLNLIALNPATPNYDVVEDGTATTINENQINMASLLKIAEYGSDGRVTDLIASTVSGIYKDAKWITTEEINTDTADTTEKVQTRGVRAIGVASNMTPAERILNEARLAFNTNKNKASDGVADAVDKNESVFFNMLQKEDGATYTSAELQALYEVAKGVESSLNTIVKAYSNAAIATVATTDIAEEKLATLQEQLTNNTSAAMLSSLLQSAGADNTYATRLTELAAEQTEVASILGLFTVTDGVVSGHTATDVKTDIMKPLIGDSSTVYALDKDGTSVTLSTENAGNIASVYVTGGLIGTIAEEAGDFYLTTYVIVPVYAGVATTEITTTGEGDSATTTTVVTIADTGNLDAVAGELSGLSITKEGEDDEKTISDFYGYILDFAFRTNAASSYLQLQTTATNRVYSDAQGDDLATQGAGSTATFAYDDEMTQAQVTALLEAVRLIFLNPDETNGGEVYATAKLSEITFNSATHTATADVILDKRSTAEDTGATATSIVALPQNTAKKVSVMVYLEGDEVDNSDVVNAASSGMLNLNLQFSSSVNLIPMQNTALKEMVITYTELTADDDADYVAGLYTFNGALYDINEGYHIYNGSDGMIYFGKVAEGADEPESYTKLTVVTASTALTPVTVTIKSSTNNNIVETGTSATLTATIAGNSDFATKHTLKSFEWSTESTNITLPTDDVTTDTSVVVSGNTAGDATITGTITFETQYYPVDENGTVATTTTTRETIVKITYNVTVTSAATETETYTVTITQPEDGKVTADVASAKEGDTVTLSGTDGYTIVVTGENNQTVTVTENKFQMPASNVNVTVT